MLIPFDMAGHDHLRVVNAGVGDAGLSSIEGRQRHSPDAEILLIDRREAHPKVGRLLTQTGDSADCGISLKLNCSCTLSEGVKSPMRTMEALIEKG